MKLCRFEPIAEPDSVRTGIVHGGRIYETDGTNPVAVHEASDVRPLSPIGRPPTVRFFRNPTRIGTRLTNDEAELLPYLFGNPSALIGPSQTIEAPSYIQDLQFEPYVAAVVAAPVYRIPVDQADGAILGFTVVNLFVGRGLIQRSESARSYDFAAAIGPVLTTPEELDDFLVDEEFGRRFKLEIIGRVNGIERNRGNLEDLPITFAQAIAVASEAAPLAEGDLIAAGPIGGWSDADSGLEPGDEIQVAVENLGTLSTKVAADSVMPA